MSFMGTSPGMQGGPMHIGAGGQVYAGQNPTGRYTGGQTMQPGGGGAPQPTPMPGGGQQTPVGQPVGQSGFRPVMGPGGQLINPQTGGAWGQGAWGPGSQWYAMHHGNPMGGGPATMPGQQGFGPGGMQGGPATINGQPSFNGPPGLLGALGPINPPGQQQMTGGPATAPGFGAFGGQQTMHPGPVTTGLRPFEGGQQNMTGGPATMPGAQPGLTFGTGMNQGMPPPPMGMNPQMWQQLLARLNGQQPFAPRPMF